MAPASATQKSNNAKDKKHISRASSVSKTEPESPTENGSEPAYLKELQKSLRNAVKKLNATAKVDIIISENPGKSLDELVEEKKINGDQKAQALKKPALQAAISQIEEQIGHYKEIAAQYEEKLVSQKAAITKGHQEELEAVRANAIADATETSTQLLRGQLLTVSKFLCAAANLRRAGDETAEGRAFEAVLYQVYGGSQDAVTSMLKLIEGADEKLQDIEGVSLDLTYGDVKQTSNQHAPVEESTEPATDSTITSDPTLVNAGLTELQDTSISTAAATQAEGTTPQADQVAPPAQTGTGNGGNPVADATYDPTSMTSSATTDGWVEVPRDPAETETGLQATPADTETNNTTENASGAKENSGRGRGRNGRGRGDGSRGGRGRENRGRGDFRGRGRGGRGGKRGGANGSPTATPTGEKQ
ncbi:hypothetical protein N7456_008572 [Penicillium angulare]|uniref:YAG7-like dimerisation domain-containing protein n=1 Tax=Penicillium angulare TaxID=116970 RepID=A0A9W9F3B1_9EURO|nr:hypothetical protein N7456_008572 [Penicillium angulare]